MASILTPVALTQASRGAKKIKEPRALGLLEFGPNKKPRLIPIEILYDGQYYDAGAYKASPVPLALWSGTVYEGFQSGVSQGLFTVTGALENPETKQWLAEGTWLPADMIAKKSAKKPVSAEPRGLNDDSGPPVLRRAATAEQPKPPETPPAPPVPAAAPQPPSATSAPPATPSAAAPQPATTSAAAAPPTETAPPEDPNRPTLKRGKPAPKPLEPLPSAEASAPQPAAKSTAQPQAPFAAAKAAPMQLIPAISDADGPDPQSYKYDMKPDDENQLRTKVLALAADEVRARAKQLSAATTPSSEPTHKPGQRAKSAASHPPQPVFTDVQFRAFDLSNSNEPVLIVTAAARLPQSPKANAEPSQLQFLVTVVARQDINGDLHRVFSNVTDTDHLDVLPQMKFIDAVDADGDGRGELLFRQVSDAGSAFVVYRVIGNQLWALFQGAPGT